MGEPRKDGPPSLQAQLEAAQKAAEHYRDSLNERLMMEGPVAKLFNVVESGHVKEMGEVEKGELGMDYEEAMRSLNSNLTYLVRDMRTNLSPQTWPLLSVQQSVDSMRQTLKTKASVRGRHRMITEDDKDKPEVVESKSVDRAFRSRISADLNRLYGHTMFAEHTSSIMGLYFEGKGMIGILDTGRRLSVVNTDQIRLAYGKIKDAGLKKEYVDQLPNEMREGAIDKMTKYSAQMLHFDEAICAMNQFDPDAPAGQEMPMKVSEVKRQFLGSLFTRLPRLDEDGVDRNKPSDLTREVVKNDKTFHINVLSYYNTARTQKEYDKYQALMMSLAMNDAFTVLKGLPSKWEDLLADGAADTTYKNFFIKVQATANEILENWDSPEVSIEREMAAAAFEHEYMFNVGTLNISDLGYAHNWSDHLDLTNLVEGKPTATKYLAEIGGPSVALDAMNAKYAFFHEITYRLKSRISTPMLPPTNREVIEDWVNYTTKGGKDKKLSEKLSKNKFLRRGAGIIGLFPNEFGKDKEWLEGKQFREELGLEFNPDALKFLEENMWGLPTVYGVDFPMPIIPFVESINLLSAMRVSKDKSVKDVLREGEKLITEIDFENYDSFVADGNQASGKFIMNFTKMMWGRADRKSMDEFFSAPFTALTDTIKWGDIGFRNEKTNKKIHEITQSCYLIVAYLAFFRAGLWDGGEKFKANKELFINSMGVPGDLSLESYIEAASYLPKNKQGVFPHYQDSFILLLIGLTEFVKGIGQEADAQYKGTEELKQTVSKYLKKT